MIKIRYILIIPLVFLLSSCMTFMITTTESMRKKIIRKNPGVTDVGIIFDWTQSDNKFIALELKLEGERKLFLTSVNWRKMPDREPFYLSGIGNYSFSKIYHFVYKDKKETYKVSFLEGAYYGLPSLSKKIGVQLNTIRDLITNYDKIYFFVESLPLINNEDDITLQKKLEEGELTKNDYYETEKYFVSQYSAKSIWNDECYGEGWRRPDYENNEIIIEYYLYNFPYHVNKGKGKELEHRNSPIPQPATQE